MPAKRPSGRSPTATLSVDRSFYLLYTEAAFGVCFRERTEKGIRLEPGAAPQR